MTKQSEKVSALDPEITIHRLAALSTSILADAARGHGVIAPGLIRFSGAGTVAGRAVTAACAEGSLQPVFPALEQAKPGDILCVTGPGTSAYLGDLLATNIVQRGLAGAVIDGLIRDRATVAAMPASFYARGLTPVALRRDEPGQAMVPLIIGGVAIHPGDWVVVDDDGVIVVAPSEVEAVLAGAEDAARIEERMMELIGRGVPVTDAVRQAQAEEEREKQG